MGQWGRLSNDEQAIAILVLVIYFLPMIIAISRNTSNRNTVSVVTIFTGWTGIGWIVALAMSVSGAKEQ